MNIFKKLKHPGEYRKPRKEIYGHMNQELEFSKQIRIVSIGRISYARVSMYVYNSQTRNISKNMLSLKAK